MDLTAYAIEAELEEHHWWFVGRRRLFARILEDLAVPRNAAFLDIGTSTGSNLRLLRQLGYSNVSGVDRSQEAIDFCMTKGLGSVALGDTCDLPFENERFGVVLATDIIEHVDDDLCALKEIRRVLKPGGHAVITVPAFKILWGLQDEAGHHKRRYRLGELVEKVLEADLVPVRQHYFNYLLFIPILTARWLIKSLHLRIENENTLTTPLMNRILLAIFDLDVRTAPRLRPPFGVSCLLVVERKPP